MRLETMDPDPTWDAAAHADAVEALGREGLTFKVWGGDWCVDCRRELPALGAALEAAGVPDERVEHYPVEKREDGSKEGPRVEEYDVELIPTVVVEYEGREVARFVEDAPVSIPVSLAESLGEAELEA